MNRLQSRTLLMATLVFVVLGLFGLQQAGFLLPAESVVLRPIVGFQQFLSTQYNGILALFTSPSDLKALRERNAQLEQTVAQLQLEVIRLKEQEAELHILEGLVSYARQAPENRYVAADVIARDPNPFLRYIVINKGSDSGVAKDMPVITAEGLVGRVVQATAFAAKVELIVDPSAAVNARIQESRGEGVVSGQLAGDLRMEYISQEVKAEPGQKVLTSGLGRRYPPDLLIGEITSVRRRDFELFQEADIRPSVDFSSVEIVLVITNFTPLGLNEFEATPAP